MLFSWLGLKRVGFSVSFPISFTGAELEKCQACFVERRYHEKADHHFKEKPS
jgi:hypothetical protein